MFSVYTTPRVYPIFGPTRISHRAPSYISASPSLDLLEDILPLFLSLGAPNCHPRHHQRQQPVVLQPRFDLRETETTFEIDGHLPGIKRENINISSTGPESLAVKGRLVRTYRLKKPQAESETPAAEPQQSEPQPQAGSEPQVQSQPEAEATEPEPEKVETNTDDFVVVNNHHATVEDDTEDDEATTTLSQRSTSPVPTPAESESPSPKPVSTTSTETEIPQPAAADEQQQQPTKDTRPEVIERTVGQFARTFNFPGRVDMEGVTAKMEGDVLKIVVPKFRAHVVRDITIA
ncbi:hypothetical protein QBC47DRAFT_385417 [Echria macrotheca]|uniref:SHSP domain-containing protein n=1 Tax=Echria macrotheca TaxID=438768 RepID=A0AAJ0FAA2_9PEZI|nr:hypothetical protein QBC47DRAFT_385417 [Echria macrotheca]